MSIPIVIESKFSRWTVIGPADPDRHGQRRWRCRCSCGIEKIIRAGHLRSGASRSCGCLNREIQSRLARERFIHHGYARAGFVTPEWKAWKSMRERCANPHAKSWDRYGGRGIRVCDRWAKSFTEFFADMGFRPSAAHSLDRIDNDGNYEPGNCRWATRTEQQNNTRKIRRITFRGQIKSASEWNDDLGFPKELIQQRLRRGWGPEKALMTPITTEVREP